MPREGFLSVLKAREAQRREDAAQKERQIEEKVNKLLADSRHPEIGKLVAENPELKHVLRFGIASGKIPKRKREKPAAVQLLKRALHGAVTAVNLLEFRPSRGVGKPPKTAQAVQKALAEAAHTHEEAQKLRKDTVFSTYLRKMALNLHDLGHTAEELKQNELLSQAILDHIVTEYQLMKELRVPPGVIKGLGHSFTVFHADQIYRDAQRVFGADPETAPLVRTAAVQLFMKKYETIEQAKRKYDKHFKSAQRIFGTDKDTKTLVRTAAFQLFTKKYETIEQAKKEYDKHFKSAQRVFGADPETAPLVRTAAVQLFTKKYETIEQAKREYDQRLAEVRERARIAQLRGFELPELASLARDEAVAALEPLFNRIGQNFRASLLGEGGAKQVARLAALELLETGERNPQKIIDAVIVKVTHEAALYAFARLTKPLPKER